MSGRRTRAATASGWIATVLGLASTAVSAYWALGGTALLETVGGAIEQWGRRRDPGVAVALWSITALKAGVALAALVAIAPPGRLPTWTQGRVPRLLSWIAAIGLTAYGGVLTVAGWVVLATGAAAENRLALTWHASLWDPWFLAWGIAFLTCLWRTRRRRVARAEL